MSEELAVGQRELNAESTLESFSAEEREALASAAANLVLDIVKASGPQTLNVALAELSGNAAVGLSASAKPVAGESTGEDVPAPAAE